MSSNDGRLARNTALTVLALVALRLVAAAWTPLTFDEAYYWMWSKHLAGGYYDHPPAVAFVIRAGTMIAGDTELGVRLVSILLALPMSFAVYRTAAILFGGIRVAATATILLNVTLMAAVGTLIVTPDAPLLVASSFVLFFLAKVLETGRGAWWLAVGAAVGVALLSKYTALFFGLAILIWLVAVPKLRRWLISPWPYLGGLGGAGGVCAGDSLERRSPMGLLPQAVVRPRQDREFQAGLPRRADSDPVRLRNAAGLHSRRDGASRPALAQHRCVRRPHADQHDVLDHRGVFHLAFAARPRRGQLVRAGLSGDGDRGGGRRPPHAVGQMAPAPRRFLPALGLAGGRCDVCVSHRAGQHRRAHRSIAATPPCAASASAGANWPARSKRCACAPGATCVLAPDYGTTGWLAFYLPKGTCVVQPTQRIRWVNMPEPSPAQLSGKLLFVDDARPGARSYQSENFTGVERVAELTRMRGPLVIETYGIDLLQGAKGSVLDRSPPPELE